MNRSKQNISNKSTKILLDANVLLEIILGRSKSAISVKYLHSTAPAELCISALTAHLVVHFGSSIVGIPVIERFLDDYTILDLSNLDFEWSYKNMEGDDFEDALQMSVALRGGCTSLVTLDKSFATRYGLYGNLPIELLK